MLVRYAGVDAAGETVRDVLEVEDVTFADLDAVRQLRELVAERTGLGGVVLVAVERPAG